MSKIANSAANLASLPSRGWATHKELTDFGIRQIKNLGMSSFGYPERVVELEDHSQWDFHAEEGLYKLRDYPHPKL